MKAGVGRVPVEGGSLAYEVMGDGPVPVVCVHGISSQRRLWLWLERVAPDLQLVAPDLRGRGDSVLVAGPTTIGRHAADVLAVMDAEGLESAHLCGMSMGGFVAVALAHRHPERVRSLTLVDGGFPMSPPPGLTPETVRAAFADRFGRLGRRWESLEEYKAFFISGTAPLLDPGDELLDRYLSHDLQDGTVRLSADALASDAEDVFFGPNPWTELTVPVRLIHAEWGQGRGSPPAYPPDRIEEYAPRTVATVFLPGLDHAGSIMTAQGATVVAAVLAQAVSPAG